MQKPKIEKNQTGKITVKHFINFNLKETKKKYAFFEDDGTYTDMTPPFHPLYVKITFKRATTQMKSFIDVDFISVEAAKFHFLWLMEMEIKLITDVITREYKKLGDKFNLKGISEKCKPFYKRIDEFFPSTLLVKDYNKMILTSRSPYMRLLIWKSNKISASVYYDAASKLLGEIPELEILKENFITLSLFEKAIKKHKIGNRLVLQWIYGDLKELFSKNALESGLSFNQVVKLVNTIDELIKKIE